MRRLSFGAPSTVFGRSRLPGDVPWSVFEFQSTRQFGGSKSFFAAVYAALKSGSSSRSGTKCPDRFRALGLPCTRVRNTKPEIFGDAEVEVKSAETHSAAAMPAVVAVWHHYESGVRRPDAEEVIGALYGVDARPIIETRRLVIMQSKACGRVPAHLQRERVERGDELGGWQIVNGAEGRNDSGLHAGRPEGVWRRDMERRMASLAS